MPVEELSKPASVPQRAPHRRFRPIPETASEVELTSTPETPHGLLYPGEPETCRRDLRQFLPVLAHLALLVGAFKTYDLEGRGFRLLSYLALAALPIHYALPFRLKRPFFVGVSIVGIGLVFGTAVAAVVVALAALLIGVCYLPTSWIRRAAIVAGLGLVMALARAGRIDLAMPTLVWPVLASMFMFRIIVFLYELKHAKTPEPLGAAVGYFFLLPNYCFLHFPVVDYRTYRRSYFSAEVHEAQRSGLAMMLKGTLHLLIYRLIYQRLLIPPGSVEGPGTLLAYLTCNYLLYLRVSGQFHIACGMLHLFGHKLPETHHNYLLATGFTDYWRRINIYWKDFMVRVVFNPVVFRLKRWPTSKALAAATLVVFLATWALHAYQSFWLRGSWGFSLPDALFWGVLGALVMVNVQLDARRSRGRSRSLTPKAQGFDPKAFALRSAKVLGTLTTIALLWSLWSSPSLTAWLSMLGRGLGIGG